MAVGSNVIAIIVTAPDGTTKKAYKITITRSSVIGSAANGPETAYQLVASEPGNATEAGPVVHQAVSPNGDGINDFLKIDGIENFSDNKLTIINKKGGKVFEALSYDNTLKIFDGYSTISRAMCPQGSYFIYAAI